MPELPDITVYCEALERFCVGRPLERLRVQSPFLLRTVDPPVAAFEGRTVSAVRRIGKRIVLDFGEDLFAVLHLMIAGRLHWKPPRARLSGRVGLAAFDFANGSLLLTEASSKKRASLHLIRGEEDLHALDPGGLEALNATLEEFRGALTVNNHTLKRALTDPGILSGVGNAYSDEILHRARLSPFQQTQRLDRESLSRLREAARAVLSEWTDRLRRETGEAFPEKITPFRPGMAVHGRFGQPCPVCSTPVQRLVYAENEANYCPACQTGGTLLRDRALSRLLRQDWPRTLDELERRRAVATESTSEPPRSAKRSEAGR